jgi:hypothetical protein
MFPLPALFIINASLRGIASPLEYIWQTAFRILSPLKGYLCVKIQCAICFFSNPLEDNLVVGL